MDLHLSDYQQLMVDSFREFLTRQATPDAVRAAEKTAGHDAALWGRFVDLGGHVLSLPEPAGGGGGTLLDAVLVGMECGRRVAPIPYADVVAALRLVAAASGALPPELGGGALATIAPAGAHTLVRSDDGRVSG